jgi:hypothetical protein
MGRLAISPLHRALVFAALTANGLVALAALVDSAETLVAITAFAAMPIALLQLEPHPWAFRFTAASLALAYGTIAIIFLLFGGMVFAPAAVLLGCAALMPTGSDRVRRYLWGALWFAMAIMLVITTLLIIARM